MGFSWFKPTSKKNAVSNTTNNAVENDVAPGQPQPLVDIELPEFKYFVDTKDLALPFKLNQTSLEEWFNSLNPAVESYFACQQLYKVLNTLNAKQIAPALRFALLDFIAVVLPPLVKRLEQPILERKASLTDEARRHHEIIVADYVLLAQAFSLVAQDVIAARVNKQTEQLLVRSLFTALETLKKVLLYIGEAYEQPYEGFWSSCYRLYRCAEQFDLLDLNVKDGTVKEDLRGGLSIDFSFKSLLVFYLSGLNQYKPKTMKELLNMFMIWAPYAKIYKKIDTLDSKLFFAFSLDHDAPPVFLGRFNKRNADIRYLNTTEIAKIVYDNLRNKTAALLEIHTMKRQELAQLVKSLSMGAHRKFMRVPENKHYSGIIGYEHILGYLHKLAGGKEQDAEMSDPKIVGQWKVPDLELLPLIDYEKEFGSISWSKMPDEQSSDMQAASIWNRENDRSQEKFDRLKIVDSSIKGYGLVCAERHTKAEIGEFIGILVDDKAKADTFEVGIIRRISQVKSGSVSLGVELFSSSTEAVCIYKAGNILSKRWAILLRGIASINLPDSIIYDNQGGTLGDDICLLQGDTTTAVNAQLGKVLHSTGSLWHREFSIVADSG